MHSKKLIVIFSILVSGVSATDVSGTISSNQTWVPYYSPYVVTGGDGGPGIEFPPDYPEGK